MRTPYTTGRTAGDAISYVYQLLYELSIENMTPDRDVDEMNARVNALIWLVKNCGHDGCHESNSRMFLTKGMVLEATVTLTLRSEEPGEDRGETL